MYNHKFMRYCKEYQKIENYELAKADNFKGWHCHHRLELTLDNEYAHSKEDLIRLNMYYNRPYFELIFLPNNEHHKLHNNIDKNKYSKISNILKNTFKSEFGKLFFEYYGFGRATNPKLYYYEHTYYRRHNKLRGIK